MSTSPINREQIASALRRWMEKTEVSQNAAARQLRISAATLSQILNGKWELISDQMFLQLRSQLKMGNSWEIMQTPNLNRIHALCDDARINSRMLGVAGASGLGKTSALDVYRTSHPNTWYVLCDSEMKKKDLVREITRAMGIEADGTIRELLVKICDKLNATPHGLLIFDDCGKLKIEFLRIIQFLFDKTDGVSGDRTTGIIVSGTEDFYHTFMRHAAKGSYSMPELRRRIGYWLRLNRPNRAIIKSIAEFNGIQDADILKYLYACVKDYGTLRELITNIKRLGDQPLSTDTLGSIHVGNEMEVAHG